MASEIKTNRQKIIIEFLETGAKTLHEIVKNCAYSESKETITVMKRTLKKLYIEKIIGYENEKFFITEEYKANKRKKEKWL